MHHTHIMWCLIYYNPHVLMDTFKLFRVHAKYCHLSRHSSLQHAVLHLCHRSLCLSQRSSCAGHSNDLFRRIEECARGLMLHREAATRLLPVAPTRHAYSVSFLVYDTTRHSVIDTL